jgi:hypothetical protein
VSTPIGVFGRGAFAARASAIARATMTRRDFGRGRFETSPRRALAPRSGAALWRPRAASGRRGASVGRVREGEPATPSIARSRDRRIAESPNRRIVESPNLARARRGIRRRARARDGRGGTPRDHDVRRDDADDDPSHGASNARAMRDARARRRRARTTRANGSPRRIAIEPDRVEGCAWNDGIEDAARERGLTGRRTMARARRRPSRRTRAARAASRRPPRRISAKRAEPRSSPSPRVRANVAWRANPGPAGEDSNESSARAPSTRTKATLELKVSATDEESDAWRHSGVRGGQVSLGHHDSLPSQ